MNELLHLVLKETARDEGIRFARAEQ